MNKIQENSGKTMEEKMKKVGIIGAMELEVEALKAQMKVERIIEKAQMNFQREH